MEKSSQQGELLLKLAAFYRKRYPNQSEFEKKFNDAAQDLIETGDVERSFYVVFCTDNDIEPITKKRQSTPPPAPAPRPQPQPQRYTSYEDSGCGGGSRYRSSSC